ncbi:MAG: phosphotransferase enzyme family protein [Acutalibacteraceae bacterium]
MNKNSFDINEVLSKYNFEGHYKEFYPSNHGHINNTFVLEFVNNEGKTVKYILQQINVSVFKQPVQLMENIVRVTGHLYDKVLEGGGDPARETMNVIFTRDNSSYFIDREGRYWRCYNFVPNSYTLQQIENPKMFYNAAKAFGKFQHMLADFPIETLHETIPNFHNTVVRLEDLKKAVEKDDAGRVSTVKKEIEFALKRENDTAVLLNLAAEGLLPTKVTHNDTKLNNVMFDIDTDEGICVIDLDTVMPGLSLYDFGDSIRFGANTAAEDEKDISKVSLDLELFETYLSGYLSAAGNSLNSYEIDYLPFSAKLLTLECGIRFLTDYINGDVYFRAAYSDHNLVRCRTQFALVADMEDKMDIMNEITDGIKKELS